MSKRRAVVVSVLVAALAAALLLWLNRPAETETVTVQREKTERVLAVVGRVRPIDLVEVRPVNPGQIIRMLHDEGDQVPAGAPLAVIKSTVQQAQTDAEGAGVAAARARAAEAQQALSRTATLFNRGFASQAGLEQARAAARSADAEVSAALANFRAAAERSREYVITAPMAGVVLARPVDNGQVVTATTTLFELGAVTGFEVETEVDEAYADSVREGMVARVSPSGSRRAYRAVVSEVSPKVNASTGGRLVRVTPEAIPDLAPGRSIDVTIVVGPAEMLLVVPRQALVDATVAPKVYVVTDGDRVRARPVKIVNWPSTNAIVASGLSGGERVVLDPTKIVPGDRVRAARAGE